MSWDDDRRHRRDEEDDREQRSYRRDDYDDDFEDRRRRRRRQEGDATGGLIPYKNGKALASYYCGVFGLISCFLLLGCFGILPVVLGFLGLQYASKNPEARGQAHAFVGIALGLLEVVTFLVQLVFIAVALAGK
jgi:hypothetical protein